MKNSDNFVAAYIIRKNFAKALSKMFALEVPEYTQFTEVVQISNAEFLEKNPTAQVDSEGRVLAEKHGAIRVATHEEMHAMRRIFAVMGMHPVEFYDMTQLPTGALPIIATAFRPIDETIEHSAFRMFCSMLHPDFITDDIKVPVKNVLETRKKDNSKFSEKLISLLNKSEVQGGLNANDAETFVLEVVKSLQIDKNKIIDFDLYKKLRLKNDVFADIICMGININHLTPRAYDIKDAHAKMEAAGIEMKDGGIEGPPMRDDAVKIQLNQTSRKAPGEFFLASNKAQIIEAVKIDVAKNNPELLNNYFANAPKITLKKGQSAPEYLQEIEQALQNYDVVLIQHKARFGEIEARETALTEEGEQLYKKMLSEKRFKTDFPKSHEEMFSQKLAYYTFELTEKAMQSIDILEKNATIYNLVQRGFVKLIPQTYDDFLAASAAGIFKSNMTTGVQDGIDKNIISDTQKNKILLQAALGVNIINRHDLYKLKQKNSEVAILKQLNLQY